MYTNLRNYSTDKLNKKQDYEAILTRNSLPNHAELAVNKPPMSPAITSDTQGVSMPANNNESLSLRIKSFCTAVSMLCPVQTMNPTDNPRGNTHEG